MKVSTLPKTMLAGLIGRGIAASRSPEIHEREAAAHGLPLVYRIIDFDRLSLGEDDLGRVLSLLRAMGFDGINVTHPFKQRVIPLLDRLSDDAAALGAVNTVVFAGGWAVGHNTDWSGFSDSFARALAGAATMTVAQIGAGGAGAATAYAMLKMGTGRLRLFDQKIQSAVALRDRLSPLFPEAGIDVVASAQEALSGADGCVQASPVGMASHPGVPFDPLLLDARMWLAEIIYFPASTELTKAARERGCRVMTGGGMVVGQAADAFTLITGLRADQQRMIDAFGNR